ncbi:class I SAM-dependent methyltransferase [Candidatus Uabimicrobium sp. HlEnr_7]|uniref:class I SAM-dependent methyltransferase n=1 Tax=Candidatus Uabimicrobium helgolandensis TaxID=3095367 RepID=UPI003556DAFA
MRSKRSFIAHRSHAFFNPISENKIQKIISELKLPQNASVIDIGCGNGELLYRIAQQYKIHGTGVDICEASLQLATKRNKDVKNMQFVESDGKDFLEKIADSSLDLIICTGSSHALGGYKAALSMISSRVKKHGQIIFAEGYWRQKPHSEYLTFLQATEGDYNSHCENIELATEQNLIPLYSYTASTEDFDNYEWLYSRSIEDYALEMPEDKDNEGMLAHIRAWRKHYLKYGRATLGFGIYLYRVM